jgi:PBP1b-binding outer membrane lipoprotein LpoB
MGSCAKQSEISRTNFQVIHDRPIDSQIEARNLELLLHGGELILITHLQDDVLSLPTITIYITDEAKGINSEMS